MRRRNQHDAVERRGSSVQERAQQSESCATPFGQDGDASCFPAFAELAPTTASCAKTLLASFLVNEQPLQDVLAAVTQMQTDCTKLTTAVRTQHKTMCSASASPA